MNILNKLYQLGTRKLMAGFAMGLLILISLFWLWNYLTTGVVTVSTDDPNNIVAIEHLGHIGEAGEAVEDSLIKSAGGSLSIRLKAGSYKIRVSAGKNDLNTKVIEVKARSSSEYVLNPRPIPATEPVAPIENADFAVTASGINYRSSNGQIAFIGANGLPKSISDVHLKQVAWGVGGYGIGYDDSGQLYVISKNSIQAINTPERIHRESAVSISIADNNRAYVAIGHNIYTMALGKQLKKIYSSQIDTPSIFASKTKLLLAGTVEHGHKGDKENLEKTNVEIIDTKGDVLASSNLYIGKAAWSPDEKNIITIDFNGNSKLYDSTFNFVRPMPETGVTDFVWGDSNSLYYIASNQILVYDLAEETSYTVVPWNPNNAFTNLVLDKAGGFLYFANRRDSEVSIQRTGLAGQKSTSEIQAIDIILPKFIYGCGLSYNNIARPRIIIIPTREIRPADCISVAKNELKKYFLDPSDFQFVVRPLSEGE